MIMIEKPLEGEYAPYAAGYIALSPDDGYAIEHLKENAVVLKKMITALPEEKLLYRYDEGKWTIKEVLVHIIDSERIFSYRALRIARNDTTPIPGFEQDDYTAFGNANERSIQNILEEYDAVRAATIALFSGLSDDAFNRKGTASDYPVTVRAIVHQIVGHEMHHIKILREKYLSNLMQ